MIPCFLNEEFFERPPPGGAPSFPPKILISLLKDLKLIADFCEFITFFLAELSWEDIGEEPALE